MATEQEIMQAWEYASAAYTAAQKRGLTEMTLAVWMDQLNDVPGDVVLGAARACVSKYDWFPSPAQMRTEAFDIINNAAGQLTAGEAWALVLKECNRCSWGRNGKPDLPEFAQNAMDAVGGMKTIGMSTEIMVERAHFLKIYNAIVERGELGGRMLPEVRALSERLALGAQSAGDGSNAAGMTSIAGVLSSMAGGGIER